MDPQAPKTYDEAIGEGFKPVTVEEFRKAIAKPPLSPNFDANIFREADSRCIGKEPNHKCQEEINIDGSILVGYCLGGTCKYLMKPGR